MQIRRRGAIFLATIITYSLSSVTSPLTGQPEASRRDKVVREEKGRAEERDGEEKIIARSETRGRLKSAQVARERHGNQRRYY